MLLQKNLTESAPETNQVVISPIQLFDMAVGIDRLRLDRAENAASGFRPGALLAFTLLAKSVAVMD